MLSWVKIIFLAFSLLSSLVSWMRERKLISQAEDAMLAKILEIQNREIDNAEKARKDIADRNASLPYTDSLPNDGYRRD